ncbi:hypothetical protein GCM10011342_29710 [Aquisalinus flavus]|uniref:Uncharacterized protein n=1 Tax=Aquisalinus flavus TaxID=1526572 RepID=A0A8J2V367_9PROT|nr:hypothetical protein [Aquisalinus flavus]MBD0428048.1 hypothetical protein [Aquisalinus flavus]GGD19069.1 hypothetical protein GCM10011342_29710 [Aquisalinus flavus]
MIESRVTFMFPFRLEGVYDLQMPGTYSIRSTVSHHWVFPFHWHRSEDSSIRLCSTPGRRGKLQDVDISIADLSAALGRDRHQDADLAGPAV